MIEYAQRLLALAQPYRGRLVMGLEPGDPGGGRIIGRSSCRSRLLQEPDAEPVDDSFDSPAGLQSARRAAGSPVIQSIDLLGFLTLGLLGGFGHCVGMCSPFVLFISRRYASPEGGRASALRAQLWYTAGRVLTYAALGAAAGAVGGVVQMAGALLGVQRAASVVAGGVLLVWALVALSDLVPALETGGALFARVAGRLRGRVPGHPFATGLFLGLLPCGLLYSALIAAVARGGPVEGAVALALFGIGTAPALLGVSLADELLARHRAFVNRLSQVFLLVMGAWFLWSGVSG